MLAPIRARSVGPGGVCRPELDLPQTEALPGPRAPEDPLPGRLPGGVAAVARLSWR